jgi:serine-type D-Ala-D-Ala carboxypeptidase
MPILAVSVPATAADQKTRFRSAYSVLEQGISQRAFPGATFGVLSRGTVIALDGIGNFTYEPRSPEVTPATIYDLASLTKVISTTSAAMLLYDRGLLDLDSPVGDILPGFVVGMEPGSGKNRVTLRMLLAHSSGLPAYKALFKEYSGAYQLVRACLRLPLEVPPGTRAEYSDIGFILLGLAIEVLAGEKIAPFCMREVFTPLALASTRFCPPAAWRNLIPPTEDDTVFRRRILQGEVQDENCFALQNATGHAGLFSHALDVLRFSACILAEGRTANGKSIFRPETVSLFAARQTTPEGTTRALGWDTPSQPSSSGQFFSSSSIGHLGYSGTSLWIDPEADLAIVLLTNRTWPDRSSDLIRNVRPAFHDEIVRSLRSSDA